MTFPAVDIDSAPAIIMGNDPPPANVTPPPADDEDIIDDDDETTPSSQPAQSRSLISDTTRITTFNLSNFNLSTELDEVEIPVFHTGEFTDWRYGEFEITRKHFNAMRRNFENKVHHPNSPLERQIALQVGHGFLETPQALGWVKNIRLKKGEGDTILMYANIGINEDGRRALSDGRYAFISPSFDMNYKPQRLVNGEVVEKGPTLFHFALTNSPVLSELPSIALSKTATPMDVDFKFREVVMTQPQEPAENPGEGTPTPPAQPTPPPPNVPTDPPADPPTPPQAQQLSIPPGQTLVDENEYRSLTSQVQTLTQQFEAQARRAHELSVDQIITEAAGRGVPPAVTNIVRSIMLSANPSATQRAISLSAADGTTREANIFEAMGELLNSIPTIPFHQLSREPNGERVPGSTISLDEAEEKGRKMWETSGIVPDLLVKNGKGS